jgi:hypothetical protein
MPQRPSDWQLIHPPDSSGNSRSKPERCSRAACSRAPGRRRRDFFPELRSGLRRSLTAGTARHRVRPDRVCELDIGGRRLRGRNVSCLRRARPAKGGIWLRPGCLRDPRLHCDRGRILICKINSTPPCPAVLRGDHRLATVVTAAGADHESVAVHEVTLAGGAANAASSVPPPEDHAAGLTKTDGENPSEEDGRSLQ